MHATWLSIAAHVTHVAPRLHHHFSGPHVDYVGVALGAAISWVGVTGPGEALLIAAGIAAAHGRVDIVGIVLVAWAGASVGGTAGWLIGLKGGRALMTRRGPLYRLRLRLVRHGDAIYERRGWLAVYLAPSWMAGISAMRAARFLPANAVAALVWAALIGFGSYLAGPSIAEAIGDAGTYAFVALLVLVGLAASLRQLTRRRRAP